MRTRLDMWEALAVAVASNPRVRTGKQAKQIIDFLMKEREIVIDEETRKREAVLMTQPRRTHNPGQDHQPMPDGSCSCQRQV